MSVWWKYYVICVTVHLFPIHHQWCHVGSLKLALVRLFTSQILPNQSLIYQFIDCLDLRK